MSSQDTLARLVNGPATSSPDDKIAAGVGQSSSSGPTDIRPTPNTKPGTTDQPTVSSGIDAPDSNRELATAALARELFTRAREARRPVAAQWRKNYRGLNMRDYRPGRNAWDEEPAVSAVWPVIASSCAWLTDQRPVIETTPSAEPNSPYWDYYQNLSRDMNTVLNGVTSNYLLDGEINKALWDVHTYGIGYFKVGWEPWLADGIGDAAYRRVDPFTIYPDPHARTENEATYWIEARTMTVAEVDRAWPGAARRIQGSNWVEDHDRAPHALDGQVATNQPRVALGSLYPGTRVPGTNQVGSPTATSDMPVVTVLELYVRGSVFGSSTTNGFTDVKDEWRCIVVCGNAVLMDVPCTELNAFGTHPYSRMVLFDTGEWYGPCLVEKLLPIQRIINWLLGSFNKNISLMGNPVMVENPRAVSRNRRKTTRPGARYEAIPNDISWLNPPQMHPQLSVDLVRYYESKIETISGLSAMVRGFAPTGRNAQGVLDSVQDAAFVRVRATLREIERSLRTVATKMCATVAEFYDEERLMSIVGPDGRDTHLALRSRHFYTLSLEGDRIPLRFSILADAGSQLPTSKQARAAEARELYAMEAIDREELLKALEWPSWAVVAERVDKAEQQAAQAEAMQKGST